MTPPKAVVEQRRALLAMLTNVATSAHLSAVPGDLTTWAAALDVREYQAWRHLSGDITVTVVGWHSDRVVRVTAIFTTTPEFMTPKQAADLPAFDGPHPAARLTFPERAA